MEGIVKMNHKNSLHEGFKILFETKGATYVEKNSAWYLYRRKLLYQTFWKIGRFGNLILLLLITIKRKNSVIIDKYNNTYVVDCKNNINRDLNKAKLIGDDIIFQSIHLKFNSRKTIFNAFKISIQLYKRQKITCTEDFSLFIDYCWFYSAIFSFLEKQKKFSLIVAKDISPYSAAFVTAARDKQNLVSIYSCQGMVSEPGILRNHNVFENIFVASKEEESNYKKLGRRINFSISTTFNEIKLIDAKIKVVGVLLSSNETNWDYSTTMTRICECVNKIHLLYKPDIVMVRPHPNEVDKMRNLFSPFKNIFIIHDGSLNEFIDTVDFTICGGTSSAIQVLEAGKIVLYCSQIDCYYPNTYEIFVSHTLLDLNHDSPDEEKINYYYKSQEFLKKLNTVICIHDDDSCKTVLRNIFLDEVKKSIMYNIDY